MDFQIKTILATIICALTLAGCGGSSVSDSSSSSTTSGSTTGGSPSASDGISYLPLNIYEAYKEFSGASQDGLFFYEVQYPYIDSYLINPIDSATLQSVTTAVASDYEVTVDDINVDPLESFPTLQKVIGNETYLITALVFDLSGSVSEVDIQALVDEAKSYVAAAQSHSNGTISNQQFVVWAFASNISELTSGFTSNTATINAALDQVVTLFNNKSLGSSSNLHKAILQAVGRYADTTYDFSADGNNDLEDYATIDFGVQLSQLVLFSSGPDTFLEVDQELMEKAINSQSFVKYTGASTSDTTFLGKPVFYYVVGLNQAGNTYQGLADLSEVVTSLTLNGGAYSFSSALIQNQIDAINARIDLTNQYVFRHAFQPRAGDHTVIFSSNSTAFTYSLTAEIQDASLDPLIGSPADELASLVEITGPNGEYIAAGTIKLSEANTFSPATRWTNNVYTASDYSWSLTGGTGTANANGTYTVNTISGATASLTLTNTLRGETALIVISN